MTVAMVEKDMRPCEALCPKHGVQCKLKMFEQEAFPMHAHMIDQKMCTWKKLAHLCAAGQRTSLS